MTEHPNATAIRRMFQAFREADTEMLRELVPDDIVWRFPGRRGKLAGENRGRDAVLPFPLNVQTLTGGTFHLDFVDVVANDRRAAALFRGHGSRDGRTLDNPTCLRIWLEDGQVREVWELVWDLYHVDEFRA